MSDGTACDSTPHPPGGKRPVNPLTTGGRGEPLPQIPGPPTESTQNFQNPGPIHVLATFDDHGLLLDAMTNSVSWLIIPPEAAHRALLPALTHVQLQTTLKRLDEITLTEAKDVIRKLADERERLIDHGKPPQ